MSNYTTQVRFLCESLTGHDSSVGFDDVDTVITEACPIIFNFNYGIFDNAYKLPLERKILMHYYTREISEETYGLWKLRLKERLNLIMPYYNQLYQSALLNFNPLYDVDLTTTHEGNESGVSNGTANEEINRENRKDREDNENVNEVGNKTGGNYGSKTGNNVNTVDESSNENNVKTGDNDSLKTNGGTDTLAHTGTVADAGNTSHNVVTNGSEEVKNNETTEGDRNTTYSGQNVGTNSANSETKSNGTSENTQWDLFSDTPQGGINGLSVPNSSAPSGLENNMYLTTARKVTDEGATTNNTTDTSDGVTTGTENSESVDKNTIEVDGTRNTVHDNIETGTTSDDNLKTFNEQNQRTLNTNEQTSGNFSEVNTGNAERNKKENLEFGENTSQDYNETNVNNLGRNIVGNENENETVNNSRNDTRVSTTTDEYLQHVVGKSGGMTYSAMLLEYRETFINIDEMIVEELHDLFFGLWE